MKNSLKLKLVAAAVLMASGVAHAGFANVSGDGSVGNAYDMGVIGASPSVLAATLTGSPNSFFEEYANFTIPTLSSTSGSAHSAVLNIWGINVSEITGLIVEVWSDVHPSGSTLYATFAGNNATNLIGNLAAGQYHLDISGNLGSSAHVGQYQVALQALPVPEPETYAMLLAGLGLIGFSVRRRKTA
ncbi:putative secreted protein with PEP-CTERM sorting signal [Nitrosomonas sp. Nm84]|uniref:FxDxF family PEP-CTERM protein n=1 Tax=Nitrosomonas sp. Nm84 TaxID=200124 RepID=UPI000D756FF6|nr:FxDxF family PEP-CTERM protein [Nitrosomonas sp. Nm84]PXW87823.1 putative secreted protein with PEP-CTERM sorting signal [Nitrosomonas sp. Nm84]